MGTQIQRRVSSLARLAYALRAYPDLAVTADAAAEPPHLTVTNTATAHMAETIAVTEDGTAFTWSWGAQAGPAADPGTAAKAIAYVLAVRGAAPPPWG